MNYLWGVKGNCFLFSFLIFGWFNSAAKEYKDLTIEQIDSIRSARLADRNFWYVNIENALQLNLELLEAAKELKYEKGIAHAYLDSGILLCNSGQFKEALEYLSLVEASKYYNKCTCKKLKADVSNELGRIFIGLGYNSFALEKLNEGLEHLKNDTFQNGRKASLYINKAAAFSYIGENDSVFSSSKQALEYSPTTMNYTLMGRWYLLYDRRIDSAKYFFELGGNKLDESVSKYQESIYLRNVANYNNVIGDFEQALVHYNRSLDISLKLKRSKEVLKTYKDLAALHSTIGNAEKSNNYYNKFLILNDSVKRSKDRIRDITAREFIVKKDETYISEKHHWLAISLCTGFFLVGIGVLS